MKEIQKQRDIYNLEDEMKKEDKQLKTTQQFVKNSIRAILDIFN